MPCFQGLAIRRKLTLRTLGVCIAALILACAAFFAYDQVKFHRSLVAGITAAADVVRTASIPALQSLNRDQARETLRSLEAVDEIAKAAVFDSSGTLFAGYSRDETGDFPGAPPRKDGATFDDNRLRLWKPVIYEGKRVGSVYIEATPASLKSRLLPYAGIAALLLIASVIVAWGSSFRIQQRITKPLQRLADAARVASERRDYSIRVEKLSGDEIGRLTDAFNQMLRTIEQRAGQLRSASDSLREESRDLLKSAAAVGTSTGEIVDAVTQLGSGSARTAAAVSETTTTVEQARRTAEASSESAQAVSKNARHATDISRHGSEVARNAIEGMKRVSKQMATIAECMVRLSERTETIGEIIATVDDLADQSKLLAVNAAIEAAKAGEQGKGFTMVAQEVRSLAQQSREATGKVRSVLSDIAEGTAAAVMATKQGSQVVEDATNQSAEAGSVIERLAETVVGAAEASEQIARSSQEQAFGMDQIVLAMRNINEASGENLESTRHVENATRALLRLSAELKQCGERLETLNLVVISLGASIPASTYAADTRKLAIVPKGNHPYFETCLAGFHEAANQYGLKAETRFPRNFSTRAQIEAIEECIAQGFDGIAVSASDDERLIPVIDAATKAGIKVITFDAPAPSTAALAYIGTDNRRAGYQAAAQLAKLMAGQGGIAVLQGGMHAPNLNERFEGIERYIAEEAPGMRIIAREDADGTVERAAEVAAEILKKHPDARAIFSLSAEGVPAAARVVKEQKKTVIVAGFDDLPETLEAMREGVVSFCVAQRTYKMGWLCVEKLRDAIDGKPVPKETDTGVLIVTPEVEDVYERKYQSILKKR